MEDVGLVDGEFDLAFSRERRDRVVLVCAPSSAERHHCASVVLEWVGWVGEWVGGREWKRECVEE